MNAQTGPADLATGGAESPTKIAKTRPAVVERRRAERPKHVWSDDFIKVRTQVLIESETR